MQTWRGYQLLREPHLPDDDLFLSWGFYSRGTSVRCPRAFAGVRQERRLRWEPDADAWYAEQVALMRERAPA